MNYKTSESFKLLKDPPVIRKVAKIMLISLVLGVLFLAITPWQQTAFGTGRVMAYDPSDRQQNISAPLEGRLGKWYVQEGSFVKKGDPIVDIVDNDPAILENLKLEREAVYRRYEVAKQAEQIGLINFNRQKKLYDQGISSRRNFEQAQLDYAKYVSDVANIKAELSRIDVRFSRQKSQRVIAPKNGTILKRFSGEESVIVRPGEVIAELVPDTPSRTLELWIDGNDIPLIKIGDIARVQFEGWPAIQFSGWPSVAVGTFGGKVAVIDAADNGQGLFRVLIVPDGIDTWPEGKYLRQGVRGHGWILLRRVPLWYELWRKFNGFPPSQSEPV
jgi:multidrug efflux pump subunit AcrA (membrane-fusion protein)